MVLGLIIEIGIRASIWCICKTYNGIHYLYYGPQETTEDKIMRELKLLKQENIELRSLIKESTNKDEANNSPNADAENTTN